MKSGPEPLLWLPSIRSTPTVSTIDQKIPGSKSCLWSSIASSCMLYLHRLFSRSPVLPRSQHVFTIPLSAYRFICFEGLICYLYHGCIGPAHIPTVRDDRLDLTGIWTYPCSTDECLCVTTLLLLESAILADCPYVENILATHMLLLAFVLVKSQYVSHLMLPHLLLTPFFACFHDHRLFRSMQLSNRQLPICSFYLLCIMNMLDIDSLVDSLISSATQPHIWNCLEQHRHVPP